MKKLNYHPPTEPLDLIYQDSDLLLVNKPSGLLSVPGKSIMHRDCLETRLRALYPETLLVHRLDMDTSGLMIFARNKAAQRHLGLQFEKRQIHKTYVALVDGIIQDDEGMIDLPLTVDWPNRPLQKVDHQTGKPALTYWLVSHREQNYTRVILQPKTGRSHQLRVHMKALGHTILGDRFYGNARIIKAMNRMALHAECLKLYHPTTNEQISFQAKTPF